MSRDAQLAEEYPSRHPQTPAHAPAVFKTLNRVMLLLWRLGLGGVVNCAPRWSGQIMVLVHRGRTSGVLRRTPVNYALVDGDIFCVVGFGTTDWYRNIRADSHVEVWLPDGWWAGVAEELPQEHTDRLPRLRQVLLASGFAASVAGADPTRWTTTNSREELRSTGYCAFVAPRRAPAPAARVSWPGSGGR
jgi:deazaflavin-dependent oxidoreductase (nitroreductase family)